MHLHGAVFGPAAGVSEGLISVAMVVFLRVVGVKPAVSEPVRAAWEKMDLKVLNDLLTKAFGLGVVGRRGSIDGSDL